MIAQLPEITYEKMSDVFDKFHVSNLGFRGSFNYFKAPEPITSLPHDHPFFIESHILKGSLIERRFYVREDFTWYSEDIHHKEGEIYKLKPNDIHILIDLPEEECITFMKEGEWQRDWGFWDFSKEKAKFIEQ